MSGQVAAAACGGLGVALAGIGVKLIKANEIKKDESAFVGAFGSRSLGHSGGYVLLFVGLFLAVLVAPMVYLSHR